MLKIDENHMKINPKTIEFINKRGIRYQLIHQIRKSEKNRQYQKKTKKACNQSITRKTKDLTTQNSTKEDRHVVLLM